MARIPLRAVILQSSYVPWRGYFDLINDADTFVYYDEAKYTKNDWRNRNQIRTKNGLQWLTIPIAKEAVKQPICEVTIPESRWQEKHFDSIYLGYKRAPHFGQVEPLIEYAYRQKRWTHLIDVNRYWIEQISSVLGIKTRFTDSRALKKSGDRVTRLIEILDDIGATEYVSGPSARDYLSGHEQLFEEHGIRLSYKSYDGYPEYRQLAEPFEPNVSILDMLANVPLADIPELIWGWRSQSAV